MTAVDVPARLKWRKEKARYAAYPTATHQEERFAEVRLHSTGYNTTVEPFGPTEHWLWLVRWDGWFVEHGFWPDKQGAADRATEAWWKLVQTDPPRDEDLDAAMIVARALVRPVPNSLFSEDAEFLRKVLWHLQSLYHEEVAAHAQPIRNLYDQLSAELLRRREAGEYKESEPYKPSHPVRRRRR